MSEQIIYKWRDYSYLKDTYVELIRTDEEYNEGRQAKVLEVKGDCLRVEVEGGGSIFWTDVDSVSYEPDTRSHLINTDEKFFKEFEYLQSQIQLLSKYFQNVDVKMSPWEIDGWNIQVRNFKAKLEKIVKEANLRMWNK